MNRRLIETVTDSANIWLNGLAARGFILGGRVAFLSDENPDTDLMDGIVRFHVYVTPPGPAREIDFILEYDPAYLSTLFGE
jgi:phage tail sheath protein FI